MAQVKTFVTQLLDEPRTKAVVPWDAALVGMVTMAGQACLLWTTMEGTGEHSKKRSFVFHATMIGELVPYDVDYVGQCIGQRDLGEGDEPVDLLVWAPKDVPRRK